MELDKIAGLLHNKKKVVFVTGAGISVSGGIPDFRSFNGLYKIVKQKYPTTVRGQDLFDASLFNSQQTTKLFYHFSSTLKQVVESAQVTKTHEFIALVQKRGKLLRCYTQNIDGLEKRVGLDLQGKQAHVVQLHGDLDSVICTLCSFSQPFSDSVRDEFSLGQAPTCPRCDKLNQDRIIRGRRQISVGTLRPNIVLYNEHHKQGDMIADLLQKDLNNQPDIVIVMGTSLKIVGIKRMIKDFANIVHERGGHLVFINLDPPSKEFDGIFDFFVQMKCDDCVEQLLDRWDKLEDQKEKTKTERQLRAKIKQEKIEKEKRTTVQITQMLKSVKSRSPETRSRAKREQTG
ncbi:DHS-like NAD/FAD-binding domain-containing protein [Gorgonomyces haynaldii]|nr:DHS-like NAD/FAD-binding domain-containing protein [Gorgonomyces haynaldii]